MYFVDPKGEASFAGRNAASCAAIEKLCSTGSEV
jgi:hypothetical protein